MSDATDNLALEMLRKLRSDLERLQGNDEQMILRLGSIEEQLATIRVDIAGMNRLMDVSDRRLDRIERRLDLVSG